MDRIRPTGPVVCPSRGTSYVISTEGIEGVGRSECREWATRIGGLLLNQTRKKNAAHSANGSLPTSIQHQHCPILVVLPPSLQPVLSTGRIFHRPNPPKSNERLGIESPTGRWNVPMVRGNIFSLQKNAWSLDRRQSFITCHGCTAITCHSFW